jgi:1-acyl-sn-glycerol-3-phosphate acyltransferase
VATSPPAIDGASKTAAPHFHPNPESRPLIKFLKLADILFSRAYHKLDVLAPPCLPDRGPAILVCNHTSGLDPLLIQAVCKRVIVWMMAKEYYEIPALTPIFRRLEAIPVDRGARDTGAMRSALRALHEGRILGVFPEGRIETRRELLPFQPGVAQMATKTGTTVYPAFLDGTQAGIDAMVPAFVHRQVARIAFGGPIVLDRKEGPEAATARLREAMQGLAETVLRGRRPSGI